MSLLDRPWTEEDSKRHMALRRIFGPDRHGVVEGVELDLRHSLIDPNEWFTYVVGSDRSPCRNGREPFIWFPWMGTFDLEALRLELLADEKRFGTKHDERQFKVFLRLCTPEHFVYAGDKVSVVRVERKVVGGMFEHPHDKEIRLAYLEIRRANGRVHKVRTPLTFTGHSALFAPGGLKQNFDIILGRILSHFGIDRWSDVEPFLKDESNRGGYAIAALQRAFFLAERTLEARRLDYFGRWKTTKEREASDKVRLLNDAVALGYIWAKAEDEMGMQPLAVSALRSKLGGATGGRKSGEARRMKRAKTWEGHALALAEQCRANHPDYSQDRVVNEIIAGWKEADFEPPGHKTLKQFISAMEKSGQLPSRKKR